MARVFVSYRRADDPYGVGWLAERLRSLDTVTGVETAFHDAGLRAGDDFHAALDAEIAGSDLVIAVIGPRWRGERPDGTARIQEADDWVVREIASALEQDTIVLPVLVDAAEHPLASQVHDSIADIARLHALPFADGRDLDTIVEHVESHLTQIDQERAKIAGLERPIEVPDLEHIPLLVVGSFVAAAVLGIVAWATLGYDLCGRADCRLPASGAFDGLLVGMALYGVGIGPMAVVGTALALRCCRVSTHRWSHALGFFLVPSITLVLLTISLRSGQYAIVDAPDVLHPHLRFWAIAVITVLGLPMAFGVGSVLFGSPKAPRHQIGERVRHLGIMRDAERWGASLLSVQFAFIGVHGALMLTALDRIGVDAGSLFSSIVFATVFSAMLITTHLWAVARLAERQLEIERDLADIAPRYRANATPQLIAARLTSGSWGFNALLALPVVATTATVAIIAAT